VLYNSVCEHFSVVPQLNRDPLGTQRELSYQRQNCWAGSADCRQRCQHPSCWPPVQLQRYAGYLETGVVLSVPVFPDAGGSETALSSPAVDRCLLVCAGYRGVDVHLDTVSRVERLLNRHLKLSAPVLNGLGEHSACGVVAFRL